MKVIFWPYWTRADEGRGSLKDFLKKVTKKRADLHALAESTIELAEKPGGLKVLQDTERAGQLKYEPGLWEFRIPPRKRGGVLRIYFCLPEARPDRIVCLDAEIKKDSETSPTKVGSSRRKLGEMEG